LFQGDDQLEDRWLAFEFSIEPAMPALAVIVRPYKLEVLRPSDGPETFFLYPVVEDVLKQGFKP